ncbi:hypothetical protein GHT06_014337 [Daphnia sinensis]|uniref:Dehydrogenase/reductase SDR family member 11 n=1 Tax=Daphnia sinensis TaxID=1820382 RepID=A0AAD5LCT1_9CRUS|nr:hypothetical protein GHT06_014337 [Daphnia sinensis]
MDRWVGRVALVTGASVGIGAAICRKLVECGLVVVGCARNVEKIRKLGEGLESAKGKLHAYQCDLSKEEEILTMFEWIKSNVGGVDVCINNAGFGDYGTLLGPEATVSGWKSMLDVNVIALCLCTKEAVNSMRERGVDDGQIIHISSLSGHRVPISPGNHFYSATKFCVRSLTEGHRQELRELKTNIRVAAISPGFVETDFFVNALHSTSSNAQSITDLFTTMKPIEPVDVADSVVYILSTPPHVQVHDILMRPTQQKT